MGRARSHLGDLSDSSVLVAGQGIAGESGGARTVRVVRGQPLSIGLLSHFKPPRGDGLSHLSLGDRRRCRIVSSEAAGLPHPDRHGTIGYFGVRSLVDTL